MLQLKTTTTGYYETRVIGKWSKRPMWLKDFQSILCGQLVKLFQFQVVIFLIKTKRIKNVPRI